MKKSSFIHDILSKTRIQSNQIIVGKSTMGEYQSDWKPKKIRRKKVKKEIKEEPRRKVLTGEQRR